MVKGTPQLRPSIKHQKHKGATKCRRWEVLPSSLHIIFNFEGKLLKDINKDYFSLLDDDELFLLLMNPPKIIAAAIAKYVYHCFANHKHIKAKQANIASITLFISILYLKCNNYEHLSPFYIRQKYQCNYIIHE